MFPSSAPPVDDETGPLPRRIGQDKTVFVHRPITAGTIEEKMETLRDRKQAPTERDPDMLFGQ